ncbi:actin depolymerizing protein [Gonapodya prolifera JEL478]|uniref:Actin depolymerizing protein n=1 Tax=Gonapodya prolifera (strain JEL478) TaxID=1344416 RepID=A0A139A9D4_GONPJ|nr:actin depolymerizing protein [Gonapodya prolifera JEL478]|eukprot:KXS13085.1 actin depolymerizing protein [Gonapodya prolifera JEL478]
MMKPKQLDISETNIAGLGTDLEKKVRLSAAETEAQWRGVGKDVGLRIWRIINFRVVPLQPQDYGHFYTGDSYIVLNTWKEPSAPKLYHDIHFWLGLETTQDEAGTAAYKTVELDDFLGTLPVQHREIQGSESPLFLSYFKNFVVSKGGADSGFKHVTPTTYRSRLYQIQRSQHKNSAQLYEVPMSVDSLNDGDVFVLDAGKKVYQWNGKESSGIEKVTAASFCRYLDDERAGVEVKVIEQGDSDGAEFWGLLSMPASSARDLKIKSTSGTRGLSSTSSEKVLLRTVRQSGKYTFTEVRRGNITLADFKSDDVFLLDIGSEVFVWIGRESTSNERRSGLALALEYLVQQRRPASLPLSRVLEGGENTAFRNALSR